MGKLKKGLFFGTLLGASMMWLNTTQKGRETREKLLDHAADVYADVRKQALASESLKKLQKNKYVKMVDEVVETYSKKYKLPESMKRTLRRIVEAQWTTLQGEIKKK